MAFFEIEVSCGCGMSRDILALVLGIDLCLRLFRWSCYHVHCIVFAWRDFERTETRCESDASEAIVNVGNLCAFVRPIVRRISSLSWL